MQLLHLGLGLGRGARVTTARLPGRGARTSGERACGRRMGLSIDN